MTQASGFSHKHQTFLKCFLEQVRQDLLAEGRFDAGRRVCFELFSLLPNIHRRFGRRALVFSPTTKGTSASWDRRHQRRRLLDRVSLFRAAPAPTGHRNSINLNTVVGHDGFNKFFDRAGSIVQYRPNLDFYPQFDQAGSDLMLVENFH